MKRMVRIAEYRFDFSTLVVNGYSVPMQNSTLHKHEYVIDIKVTF